MARAHLLPHLHHPHPTAGMGNAQPRMASRRLAPPAQKTVACAHLPLLLLHHHPHPTVAMESAQLRMACRRLVLAVQKTVDHAHRALPTAAMAFANITWEKTKKHALTIAVLAFVSIVVEVEFLLEI